MSEHTEGNKIRPSNCQGCGKKDKPLFNYETDLRFIKRRDKWLCTACENDVCCVKGVDYE